MNIKLGYVAIVVIVGIVLAFLGGYWSGASAMRETFKAQAVKAGHAVHTVVDEYGQTKFEWLPSHGTEKPVVAPPEKK